VAHPPEPPERFGRNRVALDLIEDSLQVRPTVPEHLRLANPARPPLVPFEFGVKGT
jgi:hypothetical protein